LRLAGEPPSRRLAELGRLLAWLDSRDNLYFKPIAPLLLVTTRTALAVEAWRRAAGPALGGWLAAVGELEAVASLAGYAFENPADPFPEVVEAGPLFDAAGLGHPLLPEDRCVRNDLRLDGELRLLVVSGSNMSGKSTFLRAAGVNAVLAQAGAPVRANRLRLSPLAVGATLRVQDSLQEGKSRFYAEISRLRKIVELTEGPLPVLFLLDEILHGTNSHDRRIGAAAVVRALLKRPAVGLVTTHDLALTEIAARLAPHAANVHFADEVTGGELHFDYRLRPGPVQHSNALALMRAVGLEVDSAE
jgi:DNA mismatch repair ATPase MutS